MTVEPSTGEKADQTPDYVAARRALRNHIATETTTQEEATS